MYVFRAYNLSFILPEKQKIFDFIIKILMINTLKNNAQKSSLHNNSVKSFYLIQI